ncbi:hypothetical protein ZIOFF_020890 [Zingiber officinale]|uniref:RNase III domain-containing protein n=1 Tax=Zingiber officinale TaxID=94328 RepID=A0A8J5H0R4_ZINOF|nr:hypothetical protein ZIOFF_020890 [Zingiber officinale]
METSSSRKEKAITHCSYADHPSYQRIEFVGDAVLSLAASHYLYERYPDINSDDLTALRHANVSNEKLSRVVVRLGLYRFLRRNSPGLDQAVSDFTDLVTREEEEDDGNSSEPFSQVNDFTNLVTREEEEDGGRISYRGSIAEALTILADMVGSITPTFYWDSDLKLVGKILISFIMEIIEEHLVKTLNMFCHKRSKALEFILSMCDFSFTVNAIVDDMVMDIRTTRSNTKGEARLGGIRVAEENCFRYTAEEIIPLRGHLLKYPIQVAADGEVMSLPGQETFPNVGGKILGVSTPLPDELTM